MVTVPLSLTFLWRVSVAFDDIVPEQANSKRTGVDSIPNGTHGWGSEVANAPAEGKQGFRRPPVGTFLVKILY